MVTGHFQTVCLVYNIARFLCIFPFFLACFTQGTLCFSRSSRLIKLCCPYCNISQITGELLTYLLLEILRKTRFEASRVVFWSLSCYKELKLTTIRFTGRTLGCLLIQMQNISLRSSGMRRKQNFEIVFGFKSDTAVLTFTFRFLSSLLFSLFLPHFFFSCWAFSRLHFGGKSF